jgi:Zn-dependent M28 family amino/carboxypeptidase
MIGQHAGLTWISLRPLKGARRPMLRSFCCLVPHICRSQRMWDSAILLVLLAVLMPGCKRSGGSDVVMGDVPSGGSPSARWQPTAADFVIPKGAAPAPRVDGKRAMQYVRETVGFGSRPIGSPAHQKLEAYIHQKLNAAHVTVADDAFTAQTAAGQYPMRNIIAKLPGKKDGIIVVAGHYDTNLPLPKAYVGANDGGSSTGLLLELADVLRGRPLEGYSVWLVWLDGEEATVKWTDTDSLYGSRHLAQLWQQDGTARKIKAFLLLDMVGDADLNIDRDLNSTVWLEDLVRDAAARLGYQSHFFARQIAVEDDHLPFAKIGVPVADLIDFDYGYDNVFHHTTQDTLDKLSPASLQIVGDTVLETIRALDAH